MTAAIRVLLVDDQTLVRQGIRSLLALTDEVDVVGEGADGDEALELLARVDVDVVLLDLRMPGRDGIATLHAMAERGHTTPVLVLTTFDDDELVLASLRAGAKGYLLKDVTLEQLVSGVRCLAAGGTLLQPAVTERLLRAMTDRSFNIGGAVTPEPLTPRELDVLRLAAAGWSNREIAKGLHLAEGTVKNHMSSVLLKLGVRDRTRAVLHALESGLFD
ncbi:response regulator [Antrihabitans spumae]|uniref:Response regulator n=1 Tax=Antrihabitans spumae TaxID=3373370 RepID=A0ABW7KB31_9NOCA